MDYETLNEKLSKAESKKTLFYVSVVPISPTGQVLIGLRKEDGIYTTPGGGANLGETPEQAAVRECFEESGLVIHPSQLKPLGVKMAPNGKPVHCFACNANPFERTITSLDPDREVAEWKWYSKEEFSSGLSRQKNANRLETINQALMKFYGIMKSEESNIISLIEKLNKGGPGSGIRGHRTAREWLNEKLKARGIPKEKWHLYTDRHVQRETSIGVDALGNLLRPGEERHRAYAGQPQTRDSIAQEKRKKELNKGGPGSGIKGHVTARKPTPDHPSVSAPPQDPVNKLQAHLNALQNGGAIPGVKTQSGKPVVTDMDAARAQGYTEQDHVDALNAHHQLATKTYAMLDKLKMAGRKIPEEGKKIAQFHEKMMKQHMRARDYLEARTTSTAAAIKEKKKEAVASVKKSVTQMGSGQGDRDLDIGAYSQARAQADQEWLEKIYRGMDGSMFGDTPRSFDTDKGTIHLCKVDDGLYSGYFTNREVVQDGELQDNARVRIERMTIPELVQFMMAKEWISPVLESQVEPEQKNFNEGMAPSVLSAASPTELLGPEKEPEMISLDQKLQTPVEDQIDKKIKLLELVSKLIG